VSLIWREATPGDRNLLKTFACTSPAPKEPGRRAKPHPKPWEKAVQSAIRTLPVPQDRRDGTCLLGFDAELLVAYSLWTESDQRKGLFKLRLIAIATSARGSGGAVARECLEETLTRIESTLEPGVAGLVYGLVDVNNGASQRLLKHFDFSVQPNAPVEDPELEMWVTRIHGR
jgi:hypothetical protein